MQRAGVYCLHDPCCCLRWAPQSNRDKISPQQDFIASGTVPNDTEYLSSLNMNLLPEVKQEHLQMQGRLMTRYVTLSLNWGRLSSRVDYKVIQIWRWRGFFPCELWQDFCKLGFPSEPLHACTVTRSSHWHMTWANSGKLVRKTRAAWAMSWCLVFQCRLPMGMLCCQFFFCAIGPLQRLNLHVYARQDNCNSWTLENEYNLKSIWLSVSIRWRSFSQEETECNFLC